MQEQQRPNHYREDVLKNRDEEYLLAQRSAVEAVEAGRATLEAASQQGEQLQRAHRLADETMYNIDQSARILRGMTWSGWFANLVTSKPTLHHHDDEEENKEQDISLRLCQNIPEAQQAVDALLNYQGNLRILEACETKEQYLTCRSVCLNMFSKAVQHIQALRPSSNNNNNEDELALARKELTKELQRLRNRQDQIPMPNTPSSPTSSSTTSPPTTSNHYRTQQYKTKSPQEQVILEKQNHHLDVLSSNLTELNTMAHTLHESMGQQNHLLDTMEDKVQENYDKSRMVTRRANRIVTHKTSWSRPQKHFIQWVTIQHCATGRYLAAHANGTLVLGDKLFNTQCRLSGTHVFGIWCRQRPNADITTHNNNDDKRHWNDLIGLQSQSTKSFAGQALVLGTPTCSSSTFGQRQEWELDGPVHRDDNIAMKTRLVCASAQWGSGAHLVVAGGNTLQFAPIHYHGGVSGDMWKVEAYQYSQQN